MSDTNKKAFWPTKQKTVHDLLEREREINRRLRLEIDRLKAGDVEPTRSRCGPRAGRQINAQILEYLRAQSATAAEIAKALEISERTVWRHLDKLVDGTHEVSRTIEHPLQPHKFSAV